MCGKVYILPNLVRGYLLRWCYIRNTKLGIPVSKSSAADLEMLQNDRLKFLHNPRIAYLNINSLGNKVIDLGGILKDLPLDYLVVIRETKLDESFPNAQFKLNGYEVLARRDRRKRRSWLIEFVRQGFICKRLKNMNPIVLSVSVEIVLIITDFENNKFTGGGNQILQLMN